MGFMVTPNYSWRLATTLTGLEMGYLICIGLPIPIIPGFQDWSVTVPTGTGGAARQGYTQFSLAWRALNRAQAEVLRDLIEAAETLGGGNGRGTLYATIPRANPKTGQYMIDVSGRVAMPAWASIRDSNGTGYENILLPFNNVTIERTVSTAV